MRNKKLRSDLNFGVAWAERRALMLGLGFTNEDLKKPHIAVINSWSDINPGHKHLNEAAQAVCDGIRAEGALAFNFNTVGLCDGIAFVGSEYILPSRDLIVNEVEVIVEAYKMDAVVLLATCDKIVPAFAMAAARLDIPAIIVTGGYMQAGKMKDKKVTFVDVGRSVGAVQAGRMTREELDVLMEKACPGPGACPMMGTANTMCIMAEALGMSMPENSTTPALSEKLMEIANASGKRIVELWKEGITARKIITPAAVKNAIAVAMATGASTNILMHLPAVATEAELDLNCAKEFDNASHKIPLLVGISPNGQHLMDDLDRAGGIGAVCNELAGEMDLDVLTVNGKTMKENIKNKTVRDGNVIRSMRDPLQSDGALSVLYGNIAPDGAVVKQSAVPQQMLKFRGEAKVYASNEEAIAALRNGEIKTGNAVLILFQGAKGGPGVISTFPFTSELAGSKFSDSVALITDGRFSGATEGACIGYVSPEAALKGPILAVENGDIIEYDIMKRTLNVNLSEKTIRERLEKRHVDIKIKSGFMGIYQRTVGSLLKGGILSQTSKS